MLPFTSLNILRRQQTSFILKKRINTIIDLYYYTDNTSSNNNSSLNEGRKQGQKVTFLIRNTDTFNETRIFFLHSFRTFSTALNIHGALQEAPATAESLYSSRSRRLLQS